MTSMGCGASLHPQSSTNHCLEPKYTTSIHQTDQSRPRDEEFQMEAESAQKILAGDVNVEFVEDINIVRIFTSSTFTGSKDGMVVEILDYK